MKEISRRTLLQGALGLGASLAGPRPEAFARDQLELEKPLGYPLETMTISGKEVLVKQNNTLQALDGNGTFQKKSDEFLSLNENQTSMRFEMHGLSDGRTVMTDVVFEADEYPQSRIGVADPNGQTAWLEALDLTDHRQYIIGKKIPGIDKTVHLVRTDGTSGFEESAFHMDEFDPDRGKFSRITPQEGVFDINSMDEILDTDEGYEVFGRRLRLVDVGSIGLLIVGVGASKVKRGEYSYKPIDFLELVDVKEMALDASGKSLHILSQIETDQANSPNPGTLQSISTTGHARTGGGYEYGKRIPKILEDQSDNYGATQVYIAKAKSIGSTVWLGGVLVREELVDRQHIIPEISQILIPLNSTDGYIDPQTDPDPQEIIILRSPSYVDGSGEVRDLPFVADFYLRDSQSSLNLFDRELLINAPNYGIISIPLGENGKQNGQVRLYNAGL